MTILQSIILGIVQGITEFIPISSSAHLVLVPYWFGWNIPPEQVFTFDVLVQMGTLIAVLVYYRKDILEIITSVVRSLLHGKPFEEEAARTGWLVLVATIPAGLAGVFLKRHVESVFLNPMVTGLLLLITAALLILGEMLGTHSRDLKSIKWLDAIWIGCFQALSIFPGISRSGSTIAGGLICQVDRKSAARFSFLMSIPIMMAAGGMEISKFQVFPGINDFILPMLTGIITAGVVGFLAIKWLLNYLNKHSLFSFSIICIGVWLVTFIVTVIRG